jgi:RNA polymerase sigma-70 factor (ECF subfamily)
MPEGEDDALLEAWRAGDRVAGNTLVRRHFPTVYRFLRRRLDDPAAAKDIAQRTFLTCLEIRERLDEAVRFRAFVLGVARNLLLRHVRDEMRRRVNTPRDDPRSLTSPSRVAADREEHDLLLAALRALPEDLQSTLELHYWEDLTTAEIGAVLGVAAGTVKWRLHRARELLREHIAAAEVPPGLRDSTLSRLDIVARELGAPPPEDADP